MKETSLPIPPPTAPRREPAIAEAPPRPRSARPFTPVPDAPRAPGAAGPQTLREYLEPVMGRFVRSLPRVLPRIAIFLGAIVLINAILHPLEVWRLSPTVASIATFFIFISAAYSSIIPKTVFWTIGFLWVKGVLRHLRRNGTAATLARFTGGAEAARSLLMDSASTRLGTLVGGAGLGVVLGIYLSGGMLGRSTPAIVTLAALVYLLGTEDSAFVTVVRLGAGDLARLVGRQGPTEDAVRTGLAALGAGLILSALPMLVDAGTVGYIVGALAVVAGLAMPLVLPGRAAS